MLNVTIRESSPQPETVKPLELYLERDENNGHVFLKVKYRNTGYYLLRLDVATGKIRLAAGLPSSLMNFGFDLDDDGAITVAPRE